MLRPPLRSTLFPYTTLFRSYKADVEQVKRIDQTTKEVQRYAIALNEGFKRIQQSGLIKVNDIIAIQERLEDNDAGIRSLPGTVLSNPATGGRVFVPRQCTNVILDSP